LKVFTDEVPFQTVSELALFILISKEHKRLNRPTSDGAAGRGLTDAMWELLWKCSDPAPNRRPQFSNIVTTMADPIMKLWQPVSSKKYHGAFCEGLSH
jgi:hypothetical protein